MNLQCGYSIIKANWCLVSDAGELSSVMTVIGLHDAFCFMLFISVHDLGADQRLELFLLQLDERLENHRAGVHRLLGVSDRSVCTEAGSCALGQIGHLVERRGEAVIFSVYLLWQARARPAPPCCENDCSSSPQDTCMAGDLFGPGAIDHVPECHDR